MAYDNTNRGVLFKNDRKESDNHPDYKGKIDVDGTEYWLAAWIKNGKKGKFMSLSIKPQEERRSPGQRAAKDAAGFEPNDIDDDIPF